MMVVLAHACVRYGLDDAVCLCLSSAAGVVFAALVGVAIWQAGR